MLTKATHPRSGDARTLSVRCSCGAPLATIEAGLSVARSRDTGVSEVRSATCSSCSNTTSIPLVRDAVAR